MFPNGICKSEQIDANGICAQFFWIYKYWYGFEGLIRYLYANRGIWYLQM
eukprot:COSAG02_NODE_2720_length_8165_cov_166.651748_8_plen_50_part_00